MTALEALMPTHAKVAKAAKALAQKPVPVQGTRGKYIIVENGGLPLAITLVEHLSHSDAINRQDLPPVSAGFYWINDDGSISVEGESITLGLKSRPQDADIIDNTLHLLGLL